MKIYINLLRIRTHSQDTPKNMRYTRIHKETQARTHKNTENAH
jgi:hypothetical protein